MNSNNRPQNGYQTRPDQFQQHNPGKKQEQVRCLLNQVEQKVQEKIDSGYRFVASAPLPLDEILLIFEK